MYRSNSGFNTKTETAIRTEKSDAIRVQIMQALIIMTQMHGEAGTKGAQDGKTAHTAAAVQTHNPRKDSGN